MIFLWILYHFWSVLWSYDKHLPQSGDMRFIQVWCWNTWNILFRYISALTNQWVGSYCRNLINWVIYTHDDALLRILFCVTYKPLDRRIIKFQWFLGKLGQLCQIIGCVLHTVLDNINHNVSSTEIHGFNLCLWTFRWIRLLYDKTMNRLNHLGFLAPSKIIDMSLYKHFD